MMQHQGAPQRVPEGEPDASPSLADILLDSRVLEFFKPTRSLIELRILLTLRQCSNDSQSGIAKRAGFGLTTIHFHLHRLVSAGLINLEGPSEKKRLYLVTAKGRAHLHDLMARYFGVALAFSGEALESIRETLMAARSRGARVLSVLGGGAGQRLAHAAAAGTGIEVTPYSPAHLTGQEGTPEGMPRPDGLLVVDNHLHSDVVGILDHARDAGLSCYLVANRFQQPGEPAGFVRNS